MYIKPQLTVIDKANLIANEIKNQLGYNPVIDTFDNDNYIVSFNARHLIIYEVEKLIDIKNKFVNNFQIYAEEKRIIEVVFIVKQ